MRLLRREERPPRNDGMFFAGCGVGMKSRARAYCAGGICLLLSADIVPSKSQENTLRNDCMLLWNLWFLGSRD